MNTGSRPNSLFSGSWALLEARHLIMSAQARMLEHPFCQSYIVDYPITTIKCQGPSSHSGFKFKSLRLVGSYLIGWRDYSFALFFRKEFWRLCFKSRTSRPFSKDSIQDPTGLKMSWKIRRGSTSTSGDDVTVSTTPNDVIVMSCSDAANFSPEHWLLALKV